MARPGSKRRAHAHDCLLNSLFPFEIIYTMLYIGMRSELGEHSGAKSGADRLRDYKKNSSWVKYI